MRLIEDRRRNINLFSFMVSVVVLNWLQRTVDIDTEKVVKLEAVPELERQ